MHVPGLYLIAGMEVPPGLAPLDASAGPRTARLAWKAGDLPGRHQGELLDFARSLPQQDRAAPSRRLTAEQVKLVHGRAEAIRQR